MQSEFDYTLKRQCVRRSSGSLTACCDGGGSFDLKWGSWLVINICKGTKPLEDRFEFNYYFPHNALRGININSG